MKIIILEDRKGFKKTVEVMVFPPRYNIAETAPISVQRPERNAMPKILEFFPQGIPKTEFGVNFQLYKEMTW